MSYNAEGRGYHAELRAILGKHFPGESWPDNLLPDLWKAMRRANMQGFDECLKYFDGRAEIKPAWSPEHGTGEAPK